MGTPQIPSVDSDSKQFPDVVRQRLASNLADPATLEGAVVAAPISVLRTQLNSLGGFAAGSSNVTPATTRVLRKGLARIRTGGTSTRWLLIGDSTTWGVGSGTGNSDGQRAYRTSYPAQLAKQLNTYVAPTRLSFAAPSGEVDSRWVPGTGWSIGVAGFAQRAAYTAGAGTTSPLTYTPDSTNADSFDIYWVRYAGLGTINISIDGGPATVVNTAGSGGIQKTTINVTAGTAHVVTITPSGSGPVFVTGIDAYLSTEQVIRVANAGVSGADTGAWSTPLDGNSLPMIQAFEPEFSIIMLGINDSKLPVSVANFNTRMTAIINAAKTSGDVLLMSVVPSQGKGTSGTPDYTVEASYRDATKILATSLGCGYIEIYDRFESYAVSNAAGYMVDGIHPTTFGYSDVAAAVLGVIRTL